MHVEGRFKKKKENSYISINWLWVTHVLGWSYTRIDRAKARFKRLTTRTQDTARRSRGTHWRINVPAYKPHAVRWTRGHPSPNSPYSIPLSHSHSGISSFALTIPSPFSSFKYLIYFYSPAWSIFASSLSVLCPSIFKKWQNSSPAVSWIPHLVSLFLSCLSPFPLSLVTYQKFFKLITES